MVKECVVVMKRHVSMTTVINERLKEVIPLIFHVFTSNCSQFLKTSGNKVNTLHFHSSIVQYFMAELKGIVYGK